MIPFRMIAIAAAAVALWSSAPMQAQTDDQTTDAITGPRIQAFIAAIDPDAEFSESGAQFSFADRQFIFVFDEIAGRMRIMTPVAPLDALSPEILLRAMQANFDAVLDVRYAIANEVLWSVFIHPLAGLTGDELQSALAQAAIAADTFGTTFTSGATVFGGGDSGALHEELLRQLEEATPERGI